ncbi:MAG: hypothetical protein JW882_17155 [Deltaproteobacteria bacterium]|nr:hypothetical protein [Deltaproteobacteria bacterium]
MTSVTDIADVLIITGNEKWAESAERLLTRNLYTATVASNCDQVISELEKTWYHIILIDLDSIDVSETYLAKKIREMEPDIPIIGLGRHGRGACPDVTYLEKPLSSEIIKKHFPVFVAAKEARTGRRALYGFALALCVGIILWIIIFLK